MRALLRQYSDVYRQYLTINLERAIAFRIHFALLMVLDLIFYGVTLLTIDFTFRQVGPLGSWDREHFLFFASFMLLVNQLHMALVSESFWNFSTDIRTGALDFTLLRPVHPIFVTFFRFIRVGSLPLMSVAIGLTIYFGISVNLSVFAWSILPLMVLLSFGLVVAIEIAIMMSGFWLIDSLGMNFLRIQLQDVSRWPDMVYQDAFRLFFTYVVPVLLASTFPVRFLFNQSEWAGIALVVAAFGALCWLIKTLWWHGVKRYESASS